LDGAVGAQIYNQFERALSLSRWMENSSGGARERWRSAENPGNGRYNRAGSLTLSSNIGTNTRYMWDADFLRIRNVTLGITIPQKISNRINVKNAHFFATCQNLHIFTKYPGFGNPQGSTTGDSATNNGYDEGAYPLARNISLGLNLTF